MNNFATHHVTEVVVEPSTQFTALWCTECGETEARLFTAPCMHWWHRLRDDLRYFWCNWSTQAQVLVVLLLLLFLLLT